MKFFETYFTRSHFFKKPHAWFAALLLSPIHLAEVHYKKKYHLTFAHAKKLFVIDMVLLASIVTLIGATIFWFTYDPTVTGLVDLSLTTSSDRLKSGEYISFTATYKNRSEVTLENPRLTFILPPGFQIDHEKSSELDSSHSLSVESLQPKEDGEAVIAGWLYGTPGADTPITAELSYNQSTRAERESKVARFISTLRGSLLEADINVPTRILESGVVPLTLTLQNTGDQTLPPIHIPLSDLQPGLTMQNSQPSLGTIAGETWLIDALPPHETAILQADLVTALPSSAATTSVTLTPAFSLQNTLIPQISVTADLSIAHPLLTAQSSWKETYSRPGQDPTLVVTLTNSGDVDMQDIELNVDLPLPVVDITRLRQKTNGRIQETTISLGKEHIPALARLSRAETTSFELPVPLKQSIQGTDVTLALAPRVSASIAEVPGASYVHSFTTAALPIGTRVSLNAELRYYTDEGDQLGRGPLPPVVGKETKYWALIQITNATSDIDSTQFKAMLPSHVTWTGRTSVSHGKDVVFDEKMRTISWSLAQVPAHTTIGLYIELAFTPTPGVVGSSPVLLQQMQISAHDTFIDQPVSVNGPVLDITLPQDERGRKNGTQVVQ